MLVSQTESQNAVAVSHYYGYDTHGNVTFLTDSTGIVTDTYGYDAWGTLVNQTGATANTRLYAGEEVDPDLGLVNLRARPYKASNGRFLTIDPQVEKELLPPISLNRYIYANGDPVNEIDPTGRDAVEYGILGLSGKQIVNLVSMSFQLAVSKTAYQSAIVQNASAPLSTVPGKIALVSLVTSPAGVQGLASQLPASSRWLLADLWKMPPIRCALRA